MDWLRWLKGGVDDDRSYFKHYIYFLFLKKAYCVLGLGFALLRIF